MPPIRLQFSSAPKRWKFQVIESRLGALPVFFGMHRIGLALGIIVAMLTAITGFIALQWRADRVAALLFVPYAAWVAFATALNWSIYRLN